jgi:asparagine synthetase B (glutamine-hydrolysing)
MSDFLVALGGRLAGDKLLAMLRLLYRDEPREGLSFKFSWGAAAILHGRFSLGQTVREVPGGQFAWVGDLLVGDAQSLGAGLLASSAGFRSGRLAAGRELENDPAFGKLNGAFAILLADQRGPSIITDPLGSVQVYVGRNRLGIVTALGTHPDLVARMADEQDEIDPVSIFEFLNAGTPCFPHTMHARVRELAPGRLHVVAQGENGQPELKDVTWWPFPEERQDLRDEKELAAELERAFLAAVRDRCGSGTVGVTLSGGLDSRLVMAAIPKSTPCIGFTFLDVMNREARIARQVARCYGRKWVPLFRDEDYIARTAMDTVKLIGCEGDWVNAHGLGFADDFAQQGLGAVLTGLLMNNNVKGYYAADVRRVPRLGGLLPARHEIVPYDYVNELKDGPAGYFQAGLLESARARRQAFLANHPGLRRQSVAEWLDGYPFSQAPDNTAWVAERRLMPIRMPAMDRRLLDIACRVPMRVKAGGRLFMRMATNIIGKGAFIPDANDGVRPGSHHVSRLIQRGVRKLETTGRQLSNGLGLNLHVPTSWHDYQRYWQQSGLIRKLVSEHGGNLREFQGLVFKGDPEQFLAEGTLHWERGFRLLQLALWKSALRHYRV